ncbi:coiled-coil domain-containing protein 187 isoform X2 [Ictalurus furcatus]|uniref:coiled-coil domain-containing protein 187 isoform X2 n=1 Tax=Ictalurus furcatus TaxID=66913 RepID=UPI00235016CE|nr:coiled-coil domain-containing protein 187 isoform X2 [Ictalurus furcatus]
MAELEVDQSNLPRVQEVSQYFSVLEDGALAHNLQEQEIEQYYSSNVQRNQLVQKDIRVAKRLQDEEQQRAQVLHDQATRQLEEQDSEYARRIQEEIQRAAEEERRRQEEDEEIAKRIQEEEELYVRQRYSCRRTDGGGQRVNRPSLDLGVLRQVLQDEELAHRLQAEEEELLRGDLASASSLERPYPKGDFTVAQVAQDEEIARFMQKQEIKTQLRSQELDDYGSERGYREMSHVYDNSEVCDGETPRERLNSEGLLSPVDDCSPEHQPSSPVSLAAQQHPLRNIAEELDPTFQREEKVQAGQSISGTCPIQATPQAGSCEEPAFVAPTKRQNDKPGRTKSKEKKENSKSKENCKQQ